MRLQRSLVLVLGFIPATWACAGELVPYPAPPGPAMQAQSVSRPPAVPVETYYRFEQEAARLPGSERQTLVRKLEESRLSAKKAGDLEREVHYLRLINILQGVK